MLTGLRTRDLLQTLLAARCRASKVVLLIEDLHWIDSVSQEVLRKIVDNEAKLSLLIVHTRRPEFELPWQERPGVTTLRLEPLPGATSSALPRRASASRHCPKCWLSN